MSGKPTPVALRCSFRKLVKDMEIALVCNLTDYPRLFEQVVCNVRADRLSPLVELQLQVLPKPRGIVVTQRLCITERLQQWISG